MLSPSLRWLAALLCACAGVAGAQSKSERHPAHGLALVRPERYEPLPVRPSEEARVLAYRAPAAAPGVRGPTLDVYEIFESLEVFLAELGGELDEVRAGRDRIGYRARRFEGTAADGQRQWVHAWIGDERTIVLAGRASPEEYSAERRAFESLLASMRIVPPLAASAERARAERHYRSGRSSGIAQRIAVRMALLEGWQAHDSEHFIVISHGLEGSYVAELCREVERARAAFARLVAGGESTDAVSTVRICRDRDEFHAYGGPPGSLGYWSPREGELVLFDARGDEPGSGGVDFTRAVLLHEALHQFLHDALGGIAPAPWIDEGLAEHLAMLAPGASSADGIAANPWREPLARELVARGEDWPWATVCALDQAAFYQSAPPLYAQSWSMVHFLLAPESTASDPRWGAIVRDYLGALRSAWAVEKPRAAGGSAEWERAVGRARAAAHAAAFAGVDLLELEAAWRAWQSAR